MCYKKYLKEIVDLSDPIPSDQDKIDSNSKILNIYKNGKSFSIYDNSNILNVIKLVKDFVDRNRNIFGMSYQIDMEGKEVRFQIKSGYNIRDKFKIEYMMYGLLNNLINSIQSQYNDVCIEHDIEDEDKKIIINLKIREPEIKLDLY